MNILSVGLALMSCNFSQAVGLFRRCGCCQGFSKVANSGGRARFAGDEDSVATCVVRLLSAIFLSQNGVLESLRDRGSHGAAA